MDKEVLDALSLRAHKIAATLAKDAGKDWKDYKFKQDWWKIDIPEAGTVIFWHNKYTWVRFKDITPVKVTKQIFHEPLLLNKKVNDVSAAIIENTSDNIITERTYDYSISETKETSENVGTSVEVGITQKIGYGGAVASGETTLSLTVSTSYGKEWGESKTTTRDTSVTIEVPPKTKGTIVSTISKSDFEQKLEYWCDLEHQVEYWSHHDYHHAYSSMAEVKQLMEGKSADNITNGKHYRHHPFDQKVVDDVAEPLDVHYEHLLKFSNSTSGDIKVSSFPIADA